MVTEWCYTSGQRMMSSFDCRPTKQGCEKARAAASPPVTACTRSTYAVKAKD